MILAFPVSGPTGTFSPADSLTTRREDPEVRTAVGRGGVRRTCSTSPGGNRNPEQGV